MNFFNGKINKYLIYANLLAILVFGILTIFKFPYWSLIDEGSHFAYIEYIAKERKIPILGKAMTSKEVLSIGEGIYPKITATDPYKIGLGGYIYEAFQPPLYYLVAAPFFFLSSNYINKIFIIRFFNFILFFVAIYLLYRLIKTVFAQKWQLPFLFCLNIFLFPGMIFRNTVISNTPLEIPLAILFTLCLYKFEVTRKDKFFVWAGVFLGLIILTKLTLIHYCFIYAFSGVKNYLYHFKLQKVKYPILVLIILLLIVGPWLRFNFKNYHSFTSNKLAQEMQKPIINPNNTDYKLVETFIRTPDYFDSVVLPQEWTFHYYNNASFFNSKEIVKAIFFTLPLILIFFNLPHFLKYYYFALPLVVNFTIINIMMAVNDWQINFGRYLYASFVSWGLYLYLLYHRYSQKLIPVFIAVINTLNIYWWFRLILWHLA